MSLSCECDDGWDADWYYRQPEDYTTLQTSRRKRCGSCKTLIDIGATALEFERYRIANEGSIEERIHGEYAEIPSAPEYFCEECADLYFSLADLGFCVGPGESMKDLLEEYQGVYGPQATA